VPPEEVWRFATVIGTTFVGKLITVELASVPSKYW
jgi:hypothetical protein